LIDINIDILKKMNVHAENITLFATSATPKKKQKEKTQKEKKTTIVCVGYYRRTNRNQQTRRAAINLYLLPAAANPPRAATAAEWDRQTDTVPLHRPCRMQAVPRRRQPVSKYSTRFSLQVVN